MSLSLTIPEYILELYTFEISMLCSACVDSAFHPWWAPGKTAVKPNCTLNTGANLNEENGVCT